MPTRRLAAAALLLLAVAGCGQRTEPVGELEQPYPVTVQGAGERPTTIEARPERIVTLDPGSAELVIALGGRDRLVGVPASMARGKKPRQARPSATEVVTRAEQIRVNEIVALAPDLIVATPAADLLDVTAAQRETDAALYIQPSSSVDDVIRATIELGFLVGEPVAARQLAAQIRGQVALVEERIAAEPVVTTFVDTGFFITIQERSLVGDLVRRARGESVAGEAPGPGPFPLNRLRRLDPQVYIATTESRVTLRRLRADSRTASLYAVREGRLVIVPAGLVTRAGPRVGRALERIAEGLHPDAFG